MEQGKPSQTANLVCLFRALEYEWNKQDSDLKDVFAEKFLTGRSVKQFRLFKNRLFSERYREFSFYLYDWIILRHAYIDKMVREQCSEKPLILLGAGYDSRGLRLKEFIKKGIIEIDFPSTSQEKRRILQNNKYDVSHIRYHEADFQNQNLNEILKPLNLAGTPALVIWEGVTMYVNPGVIESTIHEIGNYFGANTQIAADYWNKDGSSIFNSALLKKATEIFFKTYYNEPLLFSASASEFRQMALKNGAGKFDSFSATDLAKQLNLNLKENGLNHLAIIQY